MKSRIALACCIAFGLSACGNDSDVGNTGATATPGSHWSSIGQIAALAVKGTGLAGTLSPSDLYTHYNFPSQYTGVGQTIVIVDAPGSANVASDLNAFSTYYHLPLCNTANACFTQINMNSGAVSASNDWDMEIGLDVQWSHAMAPGAKIVLIQAASASLPDLFNALKVAVAQPNVVAVSMSWGATEFSAETQTAYDGFFKSYPGIAFFAAAGDSGNDGNNEIYPAASPYVTGVGGTSIKSLALPQTASSEVAWLDGGGGPSVYEAMPSYQTSFLSSTNDPVLRLNNGKRGIPDVAYNADPNSSPVAVYVKGGWYGIGGTSEGAPQWAAIVARLGQVLHTQGSSSASLLAANHGFNTLIYQTRIDQASKSSFYDISTGSNDTSSRPCVLCSASSGYDDVTGLGVPNVGYLLGYF